MLNGAATKLRNAQARIATTRKKRSSDPVESFLADLADFALERVRREDREAIRRFFSA